MLISVETIRKVIGSNVEFEVYLARNGDPTELSFDDIVDKLNFRFTTVLSLMDNDIQTKFYYSLAYFLSSLFPKYSEFVKTAINIMPLQLQPIAFEDYKTGYASDDDFKDIILNFLCSNKNTFMSFQSNHTVNFNTYYDKMGDFLRNLHRNPNFKFMYEQPINLKYDSNSDVLLLSETNDGLFQAFALLDKFHENTLRTVINTNNVCLSSYLDFKYMLEPKLPLTVIHTENLNGKRVTTLGVQNNFVWYKEFKQVTLLDNCTGLQYTWDIPQSVLDWYKANYMQQLAREYNKNKGCVVGELLGVKTRKGYTTISDYETIHYDDPEDMTFNSPQERYIGSHTEEIDVWPDIYTDVSAFLEVCPIGIVWTETSEVSGMYNGVEYVSEFTDQIGKVSCLLQIKAAEIAVTAKQYFKVQRDL